MSKINLGSRLTKGVKELKNSETPFLTRFSKAIHAIWSNTRQSINKVDIPDTNISILHADVDLPKRINPAKLEQVAQGIQTEIHDQKEEALRIADQAEAERAEVSQETEREKIQPKIDRLLKDSSVLIDQYKTKAKENGANAVCSIPPGETEPVFSKLFYDQLLEIQRFLDDEETKINSNFSSEYTASFFTKIADIKNFYAVERQAMKERNGGIQEILSDNAKRIQDAANRIGVPEAELKRIWLENALAENNTEDSSDTTTPPETTIYPAETDETPPEIEIPATQEPENTPKLQENKEAQKTQEGAKEQADHCLYNSYGSLDWTEGEDNTIEAIINHSHYGGITIQIDKKGQVIIWKNKDEKFLKLENENGKITETKTPTENPSTIFFAVIQEDQSENKGGQEEPTPSEEPKIEALKGTVHPAGIPENSDPTPSIPGNTEPLSKIDKTSPRAIQEPIIQRIKRLLGKLSPPAEIEDTCPIPKTDIVIGLNDLYFTEKIINYKWNENYCEITLNNQAVLAVQQTENGLAILRKKNEEGTDVFNGITEFKDGKITYSRDTSAEDAFTLKDLSDIITKLSETST